MSNKLVRLFQKLKLVVVITLLAACQSNRGVDTPPDVASYEIPEYYIGAGDSISVDVWKNPELSVNVLVRPDGKVTLPLIGDVMASRKTTEQLAEDIELKLKDYVRSPQVAVSVLNPSSADYQRRVRVTGAVKNPLSVPYREGMTVLDLVLEAGGINEFAAANRTVLHRKNNEGVVQSYSIRLDDILNKGRLDTNYSVAPADVISVPERGF